MFASNHERFSNIRNFSSYVNVTGGLLFRNSFESRFVHTITFNCGLWEGLGHIPVSPTIPSREARSSKVKRRASAFSVVASLDLETTNPKAVNRRYRKSPTLLRRPPDFRTMLWNQDAGPLLQRAWLFSALM